MNLPAAFLCAGGLLAALASTVGETSPPPSPTQERVGDAWSDPRNPIVRIFRGERLDLWSLRPLAPGQFPRTGAGTAGGAGHPLDALMTASLAESGRHLSPPASPRTLIRRLSFDLTGLPPDPAEVDAFLKDSAPGAYERLVDRLLASPRYGEHQARLWLDVIRYSDSNGFDWDEFRKQAWRFRDYVVRAFNADKPFNQFLREQLAGDELIPGPPCSPAEQDALVATTYLRLGPHDNAAPLFNEQARSRAELMADLVETTGSAFLGLTLSCCRCHDHKYDPLSQADHFRFRAFFEPVKFADDLPLDLAAEQEAIRRHNEELAKQLEPLEQERDRLSAATRERVRQERVAKLSAADQALLGLAKEAVKEDQRAAWDALQKQVEPSAKDIKAAFSAEEKSRWDAREQDLARLKRQRREFQQGLLMTDAPGDPPATHVLFQGNHQQPREAVPPGFISALDPNPAEVRRGANPQTTGRRLTLAEWIAAPTNPLTARVWVNRMWQQHFGRGLVATPNDFGLAGEKPVHPQVLDWLAGEFIRQGWSVKQLHRLIVTSDTYRQTSQVRPGEPVDADNLLFARQNPRRLSAEQLRDALLATSGLLQASPGGPPIWPDLPADILQSNPAFLDDNETKTKGWYPSPRDQQYVRSLYLVQKRTVRVPFLETFDLPENSVSCARRTVSVVAPQALSLLNSPLAVEASEAFAERVRQEAGAEIPAQVSRAFRIALQRPPTPDERELCCQLVEQRSLPELCRALLNLNEFTFLD
ncbi:MAG: DUF1553 domain-containing protein [Verrucomicrobia bacterium]|nr:DUF1553 domain-containing protein [Verrucomicrobiota bacterium]